MVDGVGWGRVEASGARLDAVAATAVWTIASSRVDGVEAAGLAVASTPGRSRARGPIEQYAIE